MSQGLIFWVCVCVSLKTLLQHIYTSPSDFHIIRKDQPFLSATLISTPPYDLENPPSQNGVRPLRD